MFYSIVSMCILHYAAARIIKTNPDSAATTWRTYNAIHALRNASECSIYSTTRTTRVTSLKLGSTVVCRNIAAPELSLSFRRGSITNVSRVSEKRCVSAMRIDKVYRTCEMGNFLKNVNKQRRICVFFVWVGLLFAFMMYAAQGKHRNRKPGQLGKCKPTDE